MSKGFSHCEAGPLVRSSYHADEQVLRCKSKCACIIESVRGEISMIITLTEAALSKLKEMVVEEGHSPRIDANVAGGCGVSVAFKLVFDEPRRS